MSTSLNSDQLNRARAVLLGTAVGDALGSPWEFLAAIPYPTSIPMMGSGGNGRPFGVWTDDTEMAVIIAEAAAEHGLESVEAIEQIATGFAEWAIAADDVGLQTQAVLADARATGVSADGLTRAAAAYAALRPDNSAGNGSLMRTAPVAIAFLQNEQEMITAARAVSRLTHADQSTVDACVLWCCAIRLAVMEGSVEAARAGLLVGVEHLAVERQANWRSRIEAAEAAEPWDFPKNGWVVHAFQAAWSAIACQREHPEAPADAFARGVDHAVRCGLDTDTVGAIAGSLLAAIHGLAAIPADWIAAIHGWPGLTGADLVDLADRVLSKSVSKPA